MKVIKTNILICGAGITGLMMANCLKKDYLIIEKESEVGGFCRTIKKNEYIWDFAGHFFHFNDENLKEYFKKKIEENNIIRCIKNTKIWYKGELIDYPFQKNIHELKKKEFIDCLYDLYFKKEKNSYNNFKDMLYGKYGISITEKFLMPYNEKLYSCDLNFLDVNAMGRFFPDSTFHDVMKNMKESDNISYNNEFLYSSEGASDFVNVLNNQLSPDTICLCNELTKLNMKDKIATVIENGITKKIKYNILINTTPLNRFLQIVDDNEFNNLGKELSYNKVLVFNIGFDQDCGEYSGYHWIYFPDKNINFYRVGFYNNILNMNKMSLYVEIGFSKNQEINIGKEYKKTLENLKTIGIITTQKVCDYETVIMDPAYVHINNTQQNKLAKILKEFSNWGIYSIGRYGAWKYCSMEDSMFDAIHLYNKFKNEE